MGDLNLSFINLYFNTISSIYTMQTRKEIDRFKAYPVTSGALGVDIVKYVRLNSNENALGCSPYIFEKIKSIGLDSHRYPESASYKLRSMVAKANNLLSENIIIGSGSDELIELIGKAFFGYDDQIVTSEHTFVRYQMAAELMGAKTNLVPMQEQYYYNLDAFKKYINPQTKAIFIANPNNPTGTYVNTEQLQSFLEYIKSLNFKHKPIVIVDEAYFEYATYFANDYPNATKYLEQYPYLIVLRTFSKIYGLAGLRVGYGLMSNELVKILDKIRPPFNVTNVGQTVALLAMKDQQHIHKSCVLVEKEKEYIHKQLEHIHFLYVPTVGNFLLVKVHPLNGKFVSQQLLKQKILVREMSEYGYPSHIRITIGKHVDNRILIEALQKIVYKTEKF